MKRYVGAALAVLLVLTTVSAQSRNRLMYSQPAIPSRVDLDRLNLTEAWHVYLPVDGQRDGIFSVQIHDKQLIFLMRSGSVIAIDPNSGTTQWRTRVGVPYVPAAGFGSNSDTVFVAKGVDIYALDRKNGGLLWTFGLDKAPTAAPVADDDRIFVAEGTNRLNAYTLPKQQEGALPPLVVEKKIEEPVSKSLEGMGNARKAASVLGSTQSLGSVGAVGGGGKYVKAVGPLSSATQSSVVSGALGAQPQYLWDYVTETRPETRVEQSSILTGDFLFQAGANGLFFVISKYQPRVYYHFQADAPISAPIGSHGEIAYVASEDFRVYALDIVTGKILWRFVSGGPIYQQPRANDDSVYVAAERAGMYRLDRSTGNLLWLSRDAQRFLAANLKFVYAVDGHGNLLILDRASGAQLARYTGTRDFLTPISNELTDRIYLASNDGLLLCLRDKDYPRPVRVKNVQERKASAPEAGKKAAVDKAPVRPGTAKPKDKDKDPDDK